MLAVLATMHIAGGAKISGPDRVGAAQHTSVLLHHTDYALSIFFIRVGLDVVVEPLVEPFPRELDPPIITGLLFCCAWSGGGVSRPCYKLAHLQAPSLTVFSSQGLGLLVCCVSPSPL